MDKYRKVKVLGKGSFGSAILIERKADGLLFVVKEVSLAKMSKKERDEARHECTVLQQLQHPNIVRYVEQFENKNNLYIVMEYCDGGDLAGKMKQARGAMKESSVLYYFSQICLAMEYLHARHILHRDIKTMNVFLMKNGAVKLGDFGISTVLRNTMGMANTVCGTPYYFSPELCRNRPYNNKSDIWALGVLLYECATGGRHPFDGTSMNQLMQRIVKGNYAPLSSQYSAEFRKMVDWCLQKDPARRPSIKQTLALPLMRRSLEQLEENLMLATQCRVRLKDIIDFESGMDQAERPQSPQSAQVSPRPAAKEGGISPGQAAALAIAQRASAQPPSNTPSKSPVLSPRGGGVAAVVGPKPSVAGPQNDGAAPGRAAYDIHHFYSPYQRKPDMNPIVAAGNAGGNRAGAQAPPSQPQQPPHQPAAEISPRMQSPRNNMNLGNGNGAAAHNSAQSPLNIAVADPFLADMRRVDAIIAKYGKNTDERAKETIHAYMRRKQEAYLKKQKEELENRERRNDLRQRELRRVLENQRAAVSPTNANTPRRNSPQPVDQVNVYGANNSPLRPHGSPQSRAKSEDISPRNRSPVSSPSRVSPVAPAAAAAPVRSPVSPSTPSAFGRDPRCNADGHQQQPRSRPTTPQRQCAPTAQRDSNAPAVSPKRVGNAPPRKVVYAANSPLPGQIEHRTDVPEARREPTPEPPRLQSPSQQHGQHGEAVNIDWRALGNPKPSNSPSRRKKTSPSPVGLDGGVGGHKVVLQPSHVRRSQDAHLPAMSRDGDDARRRPSTLAPLANEASDHRSPRHGVAANNDLLGKGNGNAAPESFSPRSAAAVAGDPRLQRPTRVHKGYLKPLDCRSDDHVSPSSNPMSGRSPRPDALPVPERHLSGASPAKSPRTQAAVAAKPNANVAAGRGTSSTAELIDIPRCVGAANLPAPLSSAAANSPVEEALRILRRRRRQQTGASAAAGGTDVKDLPALNLVSSDLRGGHHPHNRRLADGGVGYAGMSREVISHDDKRFLEEEQRRRKKEEKVVPNTLEALRSLRETSDKANAGRAPGGAFAEVTNPADQLTLLKQRHRMPYGEPSNAKGTGSAPSSVMRSADGGWPSAPSGVLMRGESRPYSSRSNPPPLSSVQVTALSLGDITRAVPRSGSPSTSPKTSKPTIPTVSGNAAAGSGESPHHHQQSSMDGYAEMLQHLKDLLQRRRVTRTASHSNASTPTESGASPRPAAVGNPSPHSGQHGRRPLPPPLDSLPSTETDSRRTEMVLSPPNLNSTKPLRPIPPALDAIPSSDDIADEDDEDFEDAVALSPVRCAELNDTYVRLQQQKKGVRPVPDDVYTNDVDLTSANMEEELDGEEGYTGYYELPPPQELLKSN